MEIKLWEVAILIGISTIVSVVVYFRFRDYEYNECTCVFLCCCCGVLPAVVYRRVTVPASQIPGGGNDNRFLSLRQGSNRDVTMSVAQTKGQIV
jgi:hypothetical protein